MVVRDDAMREAAAAMAAYRHTPEHAERIARARERAKQAVRRYADAGRPLDPDRIAASAGLGWWAGCSQTWPDARADLRQIAREAIEEATGG